MQLSTNVPSAERDVLLVFLLAVILVGMNFFFQGNIGINFSDEGFPVVRGCPNSGGTGTAARFPVLRSRALLLDRAMGAGLWDRNSWRPPLRRRLPTSWGVLWPARSATSGLQVVGPLSRWLPPRGLDVSAAQVV